LFIREAGTSIRIKMENMDVESDMYGENYSMDVEPELQASESPFFKYCNNALSPLGNTPQTMVSPPTMEQMGNINVSIGSWDTAKFSQVAAEVMPVPEKQFHCKCKKSRCLKLYCACFENGEDC
jgi:hypothetical protein